MIAPEALQALVAASEEPYAVEWLDVARDAATALVLGFLGITAVILLCVFALIVWEAI